jgi:hypothetical protein
MGAGGQLLFSFVCFCHFSAALDDPPLFCPLWRTRPLDGGGYALAVVVMVRLYRSDPSRLTYAELTQWLQYINYAGVDHVVLYDAYEPKLAAEEMLRTNVSEWPFITYVEWPKSKTVSTGDRQLEAYEHARTRYADVARWQIAIDIDEYPFAPNDIDELFLRRAVEKIGSRTPKLAEISMQNYLVVGTSDVVPPPKWLLRRHPRIGLKHANNLVKPIYKPKKVQSARLHNNLLARGGVRVIAPIRELFMAHVWGQRLDDFSDVTSTEVFKSTRVFTEVQPLLNKLERCAPFDELEPCDD